MVNRHIRFPLGVQQLRQCIIIIFIWPIQISQFSSWIVPLPGHHKSLLLVLIIVARIELTSGVRINGGVQPTVLVLIDVVLVSVTVQVQIRFEALPGGAVSGGGVLTVVLVKGEDR